MVPHWTALLILIHALTAETISITEVDQLLDRVGRAGSGQSSTWDYTPLLQNNSRIRYNLGNPVRLTQQVCGHRRAENCNALLRVASFVCAYTWEENLQHGTLPVFMRTLKYVGCSVLEYIAAHMVAYAGEVVKGLVQVQRGLGSIDKVYNKTHVPYSLYQDMYPIVCRRVNPGNDRVPADPDGGLVYTACNYFRRAALRYLSIIMPSDVQGRAAGLPKVYLPDRAKMAIKYETVSMMFPQLCRQYPELEGCALIIGQVGILVSNIGEILRTTLAWEVNGAVDEFNDGRSFRLHHARHFIPFTVCQEEARRADIQCRYLLEDRLDALMPKNKSMKGNMMRGGGERK